MYEGSSFTISFNNNSDPLKALGFNTIDKLKGVEKPGKLDNGLNGYKKKNILDLPGLSPEAVGEWIK